MKIVEAGELLVADRRHPASWFDDEKDAVFTGRQGPVPLEVRADYLPLVGDKDVGNPRLARVTDPIAVPIVEDYSPRDLPGWILGEEVGGAGQQDQSR